MMVVPFNKDKMLIVVFMDIMNIKESGWQPSFVAAVGEELQCERDRP